MQSPPPWNQPNAGTPQGAPRNAASPAKRYETLGTTCIVLSALELLYCMQRIVGSAFTKGIMNLERGLIPTLPGSPPVGRMLDALESFAARIAIWESVRTIPFIVATGFLLWIGLRLRKGDASALLAAQRWMFGAFGAIAASLLIQVLVTVPATLEYQEKVMAALPALPAGRGAAPIDIKAMTSQMTLVFTILGSIVGTLFLSAWPIVLYVWSGKLIRETLPPRT
jgi:hypothetical protein